MNTNPYESPKYFARRKSNPTRRKRQIARIVLGSLMAAATLLLLFWIAGVVMVYRTHRNHTEYRVSMKSEMQSRNQDGDPPSTCHTKRTAA